MSANLTLARPYARAAFESAKAENALKDWSAKLAFAAHVAATAEVKVLLGSPKLAIADQVGLLLPQGENLGGSFVRFLEELAKHRRLSVLGEVQEGFEALKREAEGLIRATVKTAVALDAQQADTLKKALKRKFEREIEIENVVDPTIIGGAVIDTGHLVIDGSVRGRLARLAQDIAR
ncbi:F0F1 ATP synthase subunit delta [Ahniella affigens]|uniref:ATP synthase subunit delta n=1 Tax=Ahniella affigens TaxID=2021234 RepID=A0A2P1PYK6_9GAMM|nr:F0F1 ATP synthase subunit delta [Ahniella affigens]AVP99904.1 F0F1 ATP synthase subunit delta [Ahniella affigens]